MNETDKQAIDRVQHAQNVHAEEMKRLTARIETLEQVVTAQTLALIEQEKGKQ